MDLQRVVPVLHGVAQIRHWLAEQLPQAASVLGYDLLLRLGDEAVAGRPVSEAALVGELRQPAAHVSAVLRQFAQDGLVQPAITAEGAPGWQPTERLALLLQAYGEQVERLFIVRADLRAQQLLVAVADAPLGAEIAQWYDHIHDLGWLYLHNFGAVCFLMASLVQRIATLHGYPARVLSGHVEITGPARRFRLGAPGVARPGQVDGHAVCLIDERVLVDFGLGNVRRHFRRDFVWGVAVDCQRDGAQVARLAVPGGDTVVWQDDWQSPGGADELARYAPHLDGLLADYRQRFGPDQRPDSPSC